jgi:hypothetical protein
MNLLKSIVVFVVAIPLTLISFIAKAQNDPIYINGPFSVSSADLLQWYGNLELGPQAELYIQDGTGVLFYGATFKANPGAKIYGANGSWGTVVQGTGIGKIVFQQANPMNNTTVQQTLDGGNSGSSLNNVLTSIEVNNPLGLKLINSNAWVGTNINFVSGNIYTDLHDLTVMQTTTISNFDVSKFIVTAVPAPSGGHLAVSGMQAGDTYFYPIGMADNDYTPAMITSIAANTIYANVTSYANTTTTAPANGSDGISRSWNIFSLNAGGATISLQHNAATELRTFSRLAHFVTQYGAEPNTTGDVPSGDGWQSNTPGGPDPGTIPDSYIRSRSYSLLANSPSDNQSWFTKASNTINPLPLRLLAFNASAQGSSKVLVSWEVAAQVNTSVFIIERSTNGITFTAIGSKAAAGDYAGDLNYSFIDLSPAQGPNYYRLKMIDRDEHFTYSDVKQVTFNNNGQSIVISPNPAQVRIYVNGAKTGSSIFILDMTGRVLQTIRSYNAAEGIDISGLSAATYVVQIINNNVITATARFIKTN